MTRGLSQFVLQVVGMMVIREPEYWKKLFPEVSFGDKLWIRFKDGEEVVIKHLYFDDSVLEEINWDNVKECSEI